MSEMNYKPVVDHLTRVILKAVEEPLPFEVMGSDSVSAATVREFGALLARRAERVAGMMELLAAKGFTFANYDGVIYAESNQMEAGEAKQYLIGHGYADREFQIYLEYTRKWGML